MLIVCIIILIVLCVVLVVGKSLLRPADRVEPTGLCGTCDGNGGKCEQECMMEAATQPVEYYDDEELDDFKGRASDAYSDEEAEQFREVLYTMRQEEVTGWNRSLVLRGIHVPNQVKDELLMLLADNAASLATAPGKE